MPKPLRQVLIGQMPFVRIHTMAETHVIVEHALDATVLTGFREERSDDVAYRSGGGAADFGCDVRDAVMDDTVLNESWIVEGGDFRCFEDAALVNTYIDDHAAFFHLRDHLFRYEYTGSAGGGVHSTNHYISTQQLILQLSRRYRRCV